MKLDNPKARVGTDTINGTEVEIHLSGDQWEIKLNGATLGRASEYAQAKAAARRQLKKDSVKVSVPFLDSLYQRRTATGIHRGMGQVVVTGRRKTEYFNLHTRVWKAETPATTLRRIQEINQETYKLKQELAGLQSQWQFHLGEGVRAAIDAAVGQDEKP